jgi:ubiquinone/menaquinone biosynthesis C-methylase UbiE
MADTKQDGGSSNYVIGHSKDVTNALASRSAARQMAFLLPHLQQDMHILDVGCGPGSITCDIAELVPNGHVTGLDLSPVALEEARAAATTRKLENTTFTAGDVQASLPFPDASFDVVFCHQLLNHLSDPIKALREMKRLIKPTGMLAVREGICHLWHPDFPALADMDRIIAMTMLAAGAKEPGAGRCLIAWTKEAGYEPNDQDFLVNGTPIMGAAGRARMRGFFQASFSETAELRKKAVAAGVDDKRIADFYEAAMKWAADPESFRVLVCGELICRMDKTG